MDLMVGDNVLRFGATENNGLALECVFDGIDDYHCHGHIMHESSLKPCAFFTLHRVGKCPPEHIKGYNNTSYSVSAV